MPVVRLKKTFETKILLVSHLEKQNQHLALLQSTESSKKMYVGDGRSTFL